MSDSEQNTSVDKPIATGTRNTRYSKFLPTTSSWCTRQCTTRGSSPNLSVEDNPVLETELSYTLPGTSMADGAPQVPPTLVQLLEAMTTRVTAHDQQLAAMPPRGTGVQPPIFRSSPSKDVKEWLESFERYAQFNRWTDEQQAITFMVFSAVMLSGFDKDNLTIYALI